LLRNLGVRHPHQKTIKNHIATFVEDEGIRMMEWVEFSEDGRDVWVFERLRRALISIIFGRLAVHRFSILYDLMRTLYQFL
jgi:hypothetical protein